MSDKKPCPICGDESEYLRFLDSCAERANEKWRENEVRILTDVYKSMDFVQVVRCRDCEHYDPHCTDDGVCFLPDGDGDFARWEVTPDGFCAWGIRKEEHDEINC